MAATCYSSSFSEGNCVTCIQTHKNMMNLWPIHPTLGNLLTENNTTYKSHTIVSAKMKTTKYQEKPQHSRKGILINNVVLENYAAIWNVSFWRLGSQLEKCLLHTVPCHPLGLRRRGRSLRCTVLRGDGMRMQTFLHVKNFEQMLVPHHWQPHCMSNKPRSLWLHA